MVRYISFNLTNVTNLILYNISFSEIPKFTLYWRSTVVVKLHVNLWLELDRGRGGVVKNCPKTDDVICERSLMAKLWSVMVLGHTSSCGFEPQWHLGNIIIDVCYDVIASPVQHANTGSYTVVKKALSCLVQNMRSKIEFQIYEMNINLNSGYMRLNHLDGLMTL